LGFFRWLANLFTPAAPEPAPTPAPAPDPEPAPMPEPAPEPEPQPEPKAPDLIDALNVERARQGLSPLAEDAALTGLAASWAQRMASGLGMTHGDFPARISEVEPNTAGAENIAEGADTIAGVVALWMESRPHRANILGPFTIAGAGRAVADDGSVYWCVDFAAVSR
jgi:uncharacterized protein YkwD